MIKKIHVYCVYGRPSFPDDMLRYDRAVILAGPLEHADLVGWKDEIPADDKWDYYIIASWAPPTVARWNSFLWGCIEPEVPQ
jgi:hypothetical protein